MFSSHKEKCKTLLTVIVLLSMPACEQKTAWNLADSRRDEIEQLEVELKDLQSTFPSETFDRIETPLDPKPYFHIADGLSNTAVVSDWAMQFAFAPSDGDYGLEIRASARTHDYLYGLDIEDRTSPRAYACVLATLNMRYIVAYKTDKYPVMELLVKAIEQQGDTAMSLHVLKYSVALYDRNETKWLLSEKLQIDPATDLGINRGETAPSEKSLKRLFNQIAARQIVGLIESKTDGRIELDQRQFRADGTQSYAEPVTY